MSKELGPDQIHELYMSTTPDEISLADALIHFVVLQEEGYTETMCSVLSIPFTTTYGSQMLSELLEPLAVVRNRGAVLGPYVTVDEAGIGHWQPYGAVFYQKPE